MKLKTGWVAPSSLGEDTTHPHTSTVWRTREVGETSRELVKMQSVLPTGSQAQAARSWQQPNPKGWPGVSQHPCQSSSPHCKPRAWCTKQPCAGQHSGTARNTMHPFAKSLFVRMPFFFLPKSAKGNKSHAQNILDFQQSIPTYFCTTTIETTLFSSRAEGLIGHEIMQRRCLQPCQPLLQLFSQNQCGAE